MELVVFCGFRILSCKTYTCTTMFRLWFIIGCMLGIELCDGETKNMGNQQRTEVPSGLSSDITFLGLRRNRITELGPDNFTGLTSMEEVDLRENLISYIDDLAFVSCVSLLKINLKDNQLAHMPSTFGPNSHNMIRVFLAGNPCIITSTWFEQFRSLETLNIEDIGMSEFPNDLFRGLINLKVLTIGSSRAPNMTERRLSLKTLFFHNHIGSIFPEENFMNLEILTDVKMVGGDRMVTVPRFQGAAALTSLSFSFDIESLPDLSHLTELNSLLFLTTSLVCDSRLCWTRFESFDFSLGNLDDPASGCSLPPEFSGRAISSISKLELACYDSKFVCEVWNNYRQTFNIRCTSVRNKVVEYSDVVGASPVGAAPTTSSFSTWQLTSMNWAKTTARRDEEHWSFGIWCDLH